MAALYQLQLFTVEDARQKREALPKQITQKLHPPEDSMNPNPNNKIPIITFLK